TNVIYGTSFLSLAGGLLVFLFIPDGPFRKVGQKLNLGQFLQGFRIKKFRSAALGYFGHMWEVYTFWAFVPVMLAAYNSIYPEANLNVALYSFLVIASGGPACVLGGMLSQQFGAGKIAAMFLALSCLCCFLSPFFLLHTSSIIFILFLFIWGITVVPDSPLFSSLVAQSAPDMVRGSSITIVTCIGFSITILSIQLISILSNSIAPQYVYMVMGIGPVLGLMAVLRTSLFPPLPPKRGYLF
ncbi:MAG TPA: MFS transporter, partial [Saprospiraceae bacterium]